MLLAEILMGIAEFLAWVFSPISFRDEARPTGKIERGELRLERVCAYCRKRGGAFVACGGCKAPHHADCARLNRRCAVFGCAREFPARAA